jgi:lysophospholipase L1-like esterase
MNETVRKPCPPSYLARRLALGSAAVALALGLGATVSEGALARRASRVGAALERVLLVGIGDSLTHGTMDAANNAVATQNAYLQKIADRLADVTRLRFKQPLYDLQENRQQPYAVPTNLAVDGADVFSIEGYRYYKRGGTAANELTTGFLADKALPFQFKDDYDKVLYPINLLAGKDVSQVDAAVWQLTTGAKLSRAQKAVVVLWIGNNESSGAALGTGGTPERQPIPFDQIKGELPRGLRLLMRFAQRTGEISFAPYTQASIAQQLTEVADFTAQLGHVLDRLATESAGSPADIDYVLLTLPYYSSVGYLIDSEDLEFYLRKYDPAYTVPPSFKRVAPDGQPITNPTQGDRVALLTFGMMVSLMATGHSAADVNAVLQNADGTQNDGMVLSEAEQQFIMQRIDAYNAAIHAAAAAHGPQVHVVDVGTMLNQVLTGQVPVEIDGHPISRKWTRGGSFSLDGVHPGYVGQAFIANAVIQALNDAFGWGAASYDLSQVRAVDPYADHDGDGWAPGPAETPPGIAELLFLLTDPDDANPAVQAQIPADVWDRIAAILIGQFRRSAALAAEADRLGLP